HVAARRPAVDVSAHLDEVELNRVAGVVFLVLMNARPAAGALAPPSEVEHLLPGDMLGAGVFVECRDAPRLPPIEVAIAVNLRSDAPRLNVRAGEHNATGSFVFL